MTSDDTWLKVMQLEQEQKELARVEQATREIVLFLEQLTRDGTAPSVTHTLHRPRRTIPLWTVWFAAGVDLYDGRFVSSDGTVYMFRRLRWLGSGLKKATREEWLQVGDYLAYNRREREKAEAERITQEPRHPRRGHLRCK